MSGMITYVLDWIRSIFTASQAHSAEYQRRVDYHKLLKALETNHSDVIEEFGGYLETYYPSLYGLTDKEVEARATECYNAWLEFFTYR